MTQISIVMPIYNPQSSYLKQAIDSILSQDFSDRELIVVDDNPSIDGKKMINDIINDNPDNIKEKIKYIKNKKNMGISYSLNKGMKIASGKYIARIDEDDYRGSSDKLRKQFNFLEKNNEYGVCGTNEIRIDEDGNKIKENRFSPTDNEIRNSILVYNQFVHSGVLFNKYYVNAIGGYDVSYPVTQDYELRCRLGRKYKFANLNNVCTYYRENAGSLTMRKLRRQHYENMKIIIKNWFYYPNAFRGLLTHAFLFIAPPKIINIALKIKQNFSSNNDNK